MLRPLLAFTAASGWLNDPCGQFYDATTSLWHLYYQYNPNGTTWDTPLYWGHATSSDLSTWDDHGVAIGPENNDDGIFTGSIVVDHNNTSGLFGAESDPNQRVVALYTYATPTSQAQHLAYSLDGGYTFTKYGANPILDVHEANFRDPKVFWHGPTSQWIMVLALAQQYKVEIYGSPNLITWTHHSSFSCGVTGFQYECPGLVEVPVENSNDKKWVLILAINPGLPLGGSSNLYFVGTFDGYTFVPEQGQGRPMDFGKDFYAFQTFSAPENMGVVGLAWASNWQYANQIPAGKERGAMTVPRNLTLGYRNANPETSVLTLLQLAVIGSSISQTVLLDVKNTTLSSTPITVESKSGAIVFDVMFQVDTNSTEGLIQVKYGSNKSIRTGFDFFAKQFFVDRRHSSFDNPFFTDKTSASVEPLSVLGDFLVYRMQGIIDGNLLEVYLNDGEATITNSFFLVEDHILSISCSTDIVLLEAQVKEVENASK